MSILRSRSSFTVACNITFTPHDSKKGSEKPNTRDFFPITASVLARLQSKILTRASKKSFIKSWVWHIPTFVFNPLIVFWSRVFRFMPLESSVFAKFSLPFVLSFVVTVTISSQITLVSTLFSTLLYWLYSRFT